MSGGRWAWGVGEERITSYGETGGVIGVLIEAEEGALGGA